MKSYVIFLALMISNLNIIAQGPKMPQPSQPDVLRFSPALVDFDAYEKLIAEVKLHRQSRLVSLDTFQRMSKERNVVILDTRSDAMFKAKHIKGAIHLNFSDFTQANLARLIPDPHTKILIYCNNNFINDQIFFATKSVRPSPQAFTGRFKTSSVTPVTNPLTLALNIPTYINLYGYGYKNVYELSELVSVFNPGIQFEGTSIH